MGKLLPLYLGKTTSIITAAIFLPLYSRLLNVEQFGIASLALTAQALFLLFDLGASTQAANRFARPDAAAAGLLRDAETAVGLLHAAVLVAGLFLLVFLAPPQFSLVDLLALCTLVASTSLQNMYQTALLASGHLWPMAGLSLVGQLARALGTWWALTRFGATLSVFLCSQGLLALIHCVIARATLQGLVVKRIEGDVPNADMPLSRAIAYLRSSRALLASGLVGALAMQADKPLISLFMSPSTLAPYFLAATFAAAPMALLGAPLAQFYQTRLAGAHAKGDFAAYGEHFRHGLRNMFILVVLPTAIAACYAEPLCKAWLHGSPMAPQVANYARILLLGYGIAAIGYIPFAGVMAQSDFGFQAGFSSLATALHLIAVGVAAWLQRVEWICAAFVLYFFISSGGLWLRCLTLHARMSKHT